MNYLVLIALLATWASVEVKGHGFGHHHMHHHRGGHGWQGGHGWHGGNGGHGFPGHHHGHNPGWHHSDPHHWHHEHGTAPDDKPRDCDGWGCRRGTTTPTPPTTTPKPETNLQKNNTLNTIPDCLAKCVSTLEYNPVCGTDGQTYNNLGRLICAKNCGINVELKSNSVCPPSPPSPGFDEQGERLASTEVPATTVTQTTERAAGLTVFQQCMKQCEITSEYKPVCGTDLTTYFNIDRLNCAKRCRQEVEVLCDGSCGACYDQNSITTSTIATPQSRSEEECLTSCPGAEEIIPVCGSNGVTYTNPIELLCAQFCGQDVRVVQFAACVPGSLPTWPPSTQVAPTTTNQPIKISTLPEYDEYPEIDIRFHENTNQINFPTVESDSIVFPE